LEIILLKDIIWDKLEACEVEELIPYLHCEKDIITKVSKGFIKLTEFSKKEVIGKAISELSSILRADSQVEFQEIKYSAEAYIFTKALEPREVIVCCEVSKNYDEKIFYFNEKPNSRIEEKFSFFFQKYEIGKVGIAIYSVPELILLEVNQKYLEFWEPPFNKKENIIGKKHSEISTGYEKDKVDQIYKNIVATGEPFYSDEEELIHYKRGVTYWECSIIPIHFEENAKYIIETSKDVTDKVKNRKTIQEQMKAENLMEQNLKMQEEIFANISHELKTPLNVIFSSTQLLELYLKNNSFTNDPNKIIRIVHMMRQNCYRLSKLIGNIVDLSKINSGFFELNLNNINIVSVVEEIVQSISEYVQEKGINIIFDTDVEEKIIACDSDKIERIILNLISNAIKFSEPGEDIFVTIADKVEFLEITVKDNGMGIDENHLKDIFERFHQEMDSLSRNAEGSGLGLSVVKSIVELHGGKISVQSKLGKGSTFKIELPAILVQGEKVFNKPIMQNNKVEKINIEFSDIYSA